MSKNKGKTAEELLKEALVPLEEQPYPIPDNWGWVRFDSVVKSAGNTSKSIPQKEYEEDGLLPVIDQGQKHISGYTNNLDHKYSGELPVILFGDHTKVVKWIDFDFAQGADGTKLIKPEKMIDHKYLFYVLKHAKLPNKGYSRHYKFLKELKVPCPPLQEQKRIADKVERLLNKINQAKQLIEEAKDTFELRRAAILDKAFRGELTANWRDENKASNFPPVIESLFKTTKSNVIPNNWAITNFDSIAANERYALAIGPFGSNLKVTDYREEGVPLIFVRNIRSSNYGIDNKYVSEEKAEELKAHMVESGDILITKMGDPPGDVDICPEIIGKAIITADCIKVRVNTEIVNRKYLLYAIKSDFVQSQIRRESKGVAQQKISLQAFRKMNVIIAPYEEQLKIVEELEGLMEKEKRSIENLELMEGKLNSLEQAILSIAFRGQLGTSDPHEENAIEFLQQAK